MQVTPQVETQFKVGSRNIFLIEVSEPGLHGQTEMVGHDDEGYEVTVIMNTVSREQYIEEMGFPPEDNE